ncbi:hypothetical protein GCM10009578_093860 [Streptomyces rhizosphaericus]
MLLRLAYLAATNALSFLRLLPMSDREKDVEILVLRQQLLVLQRQVGKPTFTDTDRAGPRQPAPPPSQRQAAAPSAAGPARHGVALAP